MPANPMTTMQFTGLYQESRRIHWNMKNAAGAPAAGAAGVYSSNKIVVPKFAIVVNVILHAVALWNAGTTAVGIVGDETDDDGYFTNIDMKATDLIISGGTQSIDFAKTGGKEGAYCVGTATHWTTRYSTAARTIQAKVTLVGTAATTGESILTVLYAWSPPSKPITGGLFVAA